MKSGFPTGLWIFGLLLVPRLLSAKFNLIHDTDETYNYWEPLHFLTHGSGFQTWEYSPRYAIRSWAYIALHALIILPLKDLTTKEQQFYLIRSALGIFSALSEAHLISAVNEAIGMEVATLTLAGLACSTGMFSASTALLPSSFTMCTSTLGLALGLRKRYFSSSLAFGIGTILGWPFSAILFLPVFLYSLYEGKKPWLSYIRATIVSLQVLLVGTVTDFFYYRIWTIVPLNIIAYNVFSAKDGRGPDLFGTEPPSYYFKNLALNFNILLVFAILAIPASLLLPKKKLVKFTGSLGFLLWLTIFSLQPHKEERFMYPAYPALILSAAIGISSILQLFRPVTKTVTSLLGARIAVFERSVITLIFLLTWGLSGFRSYSLFRDYAAPLSLFPQLPVGKTYCIGSDWYRFPTSFLMPVNTSLSFVKSDFEGLLPGRFNKTYDLPIGMNDRNQWSEDKVVSLEQCSCMIEWRELSSPSHQYRFVDRETGVRKIGYYGFDCSIQETPGDRLNRLGIDLFGRKLDKDGKRYEDGDMTDAIQRPAGWGRS